MNRLKKRIFCGIISLAMFMSIVPTQAFAVKWVTTKTTNDGSIELPYSINDIDYGVEIKIGDYFVFGKYYDEPILWRCIDIDENGPLMLSDKILSLKAFDAKGSNSGDNNDSSHTRGTNSYHKRQNRGSNFWADSNIRDWLNSTADAGKVYFSCGNMPHDEGVYNGLNSYENESGFLSADNFSAQELKYIKQITQEVALNELDAEYATSGTTYHMQDPDIKNCVQNYNTTAYTMETTDRMFFLNCAQLYQLYCNFKDEGTQYWLAYPTQAAIDHSEYKGQNLSTDKVWFYWLRDAHGDGGSPTHPRHVGESGVYFSWAYNDLQVGIRPAFYLNTNEGNMESDSSISGEFNYLSYNNQIATYTYTYKDSWFLESSYTYQHDLVKMSLRTAMAAFDTVDVTGEHSTNIETLMGEIGFQNVFTHYDERSTDSIGYAIANKELISDNGEKSSLILVAVRGGGYGAEWGGNFRLGDPYSQTRNHQGFVNAAAQIKSGLYNYIDNYSQALHEELKVWIVGYSRAAATSNLVAADLTRFGLDALREYQDGGINVSNPAFFNKFFLTPENIFAFCFECPQTTVNTDANGKEFSNIVNIVNPIDFVTKVAMSKLGYRRYGKTLILPTQESSEEYFELRQVMIESYESILRYDNKFVPDGIDFSDLYYVEDGQAAILDEFMDNLAYSVRNTKYYVNQYQDTLILAAAQKLGGANVDVSYTPLIPLGLDMLKYPVNTVKTLSLFINFDDIYIQNPAMYKPDNLFQDIFKKFSITGPAACAHYPELCLAWLDSMDENTIISLNSMYRKIFINCPVDVEVIGSNGEVVARIVDDVVENIDHGVVAYLDDQGQKVIILPADGKYNVILNATDNGTVTYTVAEYQTNEGTIDRVVSYFDVPITEGDVLIGNVEASAFETCAYTLSLQDKQLIPNIDQQHNGVQEHEITINVTGNGTASGEGIYLVGEYAKICATPAANNEFIGWYENDILISADLEYRFLVDNNRALVAKFENSSGSSPDISVENITLDASNIELNLSISTYQLTATITPRNATNQAVAWISSNPSVATVTDAGLVAAVSNGVTTIIATTQDGGYTATCDVIVSLSEVPGVPVTGVELNVQQIELNRVGDAYQIEADVTPINATNKAVMWASSNPGVASVTQAGLVTAVSNGVTTITATTQDGGYTDNCEVRVELPETPNVPVTDVELNTQRITLSRIGTSYQLKADVMPGNATNQLVTWASSNPSVATVSNNGLVTAVSEGTATITVTTEDGQKVATCTVTVRIESTSGGTGGGGSNGSTTPTSYTITSKDTVGGAITISPKTSSKGQTVTITAVPDEGFTLKTLSATDTDGNKIELTKKSETSYTFKMPASKVTVSATFTEIVVEPEPIILPFDDISQSAWYYGAVEYVYSNDMMQGTSATTFSPEVEMSRGMIATVLYRLANTPALTDNISFSDVGGNEWYTDAIQWAAENNIMSGYGNNQFGPMDSVTREQLALILYNYTASKGISVTTAGDLSSFRDAQNTSDWAEEAISWAVGVGLLSGKGNGILDPTGTATRAEVAQILMNYCTKVV